jgi:lipopolysaccharide export LptBFGC system permease protein LptF
MNVSDMLGIQQGIKEKEERTSVLTFVQDATLAVTMFIGTIVTLAFIFSGLLFVFSAVDSSLKQKAKKGMINAAIGMILVAGSYAIIRLIQFIAKG